MPRLVADCDPTSLDLTPAQGFLLSRIDGATPESVLLQLGGLDPREVKRCLDEWARAGLVAFGKSGSLSRPTGSAPLQEEASEDLPAADSELEIPVKDQEAILEMHAKLDRPYNELLGISLEADTRAVKHAYFALSKEYHPDRYFRRDIGPFQPVLERVFRKIVEAYELLSDPAVRVEMQRSLEGQAESAGAAAPSAAGSGPRRRGARPLSPFSPLGRLIAKRRAKAKSFFEAAMVAVAEERWLEATGSLRLAIAFDPGNAAYRERFGEVQPKAHAIRFEQLMKEADSALSFRDRSDALRLFEDALHFKPWDPAANHTAARLAWLVAEDVRKAKEYAVRATESEPENGEYRKTLGQIYQAAGLTANARRELKAAVRLDPKDKEARAALKSL